MVRPGQTDRPDGGDPGLDGPAEPVTSAVPAPTRCDRARLDDYRWTLEPKDYVFAAGHRIGVVIFSSDQEYTLLPLPGTRLTVAPASSSVVLPVVGGRSALGL